jgi:hypothetical protein
VLDAWRRMSDMPTDIENAMINCIQHHFLISYNETDMKVAVIGEKKAQVIKGAFAHKLIKQFDLKRKNVKIFTNRKKFKSEMAKDFELLIGIRPCSGEKEILDGVKETGCRFALMPCTCGGYDRKVIRLIKEYDVIKKMDSKPGRFDSDEYSSQAWIILYN